MCAWAINFVPSVVTAYRKKGDIRQALNNYLTAMDLNSDSPAQIAHDQLISIMNFYNKDMFNQ